jgi:hypothetical protein
MGWAGWGAGVDAGSEPYKFLMKGLGLSRQRGVSVEISDGRARNEPGRCRRDGMTLNLFMAICVIGCDLLIYFLFQWTLGEKGRTRRRGPKEKRHVESGQASDLVVVRSEKRDREKRAKVLAYARNELQMRSRANVKSKRLEPVNEEIAHRRRAVAFSTHKQNSKLAH